MKSELENLIDAAINHMEFVGKRTSLPDKSIPVLWFGDEEAYRNSKIRILTMAINPSHSEMDSNLSRFPSALGIANKTILSKAEKECLVQSWNEYFEKRPYDWFKKGYGIVLKELNASYYDGDGAENRVLHIDIATPIPTKNKWSCITPASARTDIINDACGKRLLSSLLKFLAPDLIIASCADCWMECVRSQIVRNELFQQMRFISSKQTLESHLHAGLLQYADTRYCLYAHFEPSVHGVFGGIRNVDKTSIGRYLAALVNLGLFYTKMGSVRHVPILPRHPIETSLKPEP